MTEAQVAETLGHIARLGEGVRLARASPAARRVVGDGGRTAVTGRGQADGERTGTGRPRGVRGTGVPEHDVPAGIRAEPTGPTDGMPRTTDRRHEQEHKQSHAGNGTVNHGPDDRAWTGSTRTSWRCARMLHQAVDEIEPPTARWTICAGRCPPGGPASGRPLVGMAAAALFSARPSRRLLHVSNATGSDADPSASRATARRRRAAPAQGKDPDGGESTAGGTSGTVEDRRQAPRAAGRPTRARRGTGGSATGATDPCRPRRRERARVHGRTARRRPPAPRRPDAAGAVYGTFRVINVSTASLHGRRHRHRDARWHRARPTRPRSARRAMWRATRPAGLPDPSTEVPRTGAAAGCGVRGEVRLGALGDLPHHGQPSTAAPAGPRSPTPPRRRTSGRAPPPAPTAALDSAAHGGRHGRRQRDR